MNAPMPNLMLDVARLRMDFPILSQMVHGKPLVYLDNAATTQKPRAVIDCMANYYPNTTPIFIAACTLSASRQRTPMKVRGKRYGALSMPLAAKK